jgi:hypothetical protein
MLGTALLTTTLGVLSHDRVAASALENVLSRGEPAEFVHNSAFGSCGGGTIELIETVSLTPEHVEKGFSGPRPRIHHVAYAVPRSEVADLRSSLDERRRGLGWFGTAARGRELTAASATELPGLSATTRR